MTPSGKTGLSPVQKFTTKRRKLPHWQSPGQVYFITFSAQKGVEFIPEDKDIILNSCLFWHKKKYLLHAVVVMPEHIHLLLQPLPLDQQDESKGFCNLSEIMHSIKGFSAHKINELHKRKGSIWLTESYDRIVRDEKEYEEKLRYIYENPLKRKLVESPEEYNWL
jgi:putative transposase